MSKTIRRFASKNKGENGRLFIGKEWWGKRPLSCYTISFRPRVNKFYKRLLHRIERRQGKEDLKLRTLF